MVRDCLYRLFSFFIGVMISVSCVNASVRFKYNTSEAVIPIASMVMDGNVELSPIAAVKFCLEHRDQCHAGDAHRITLTPSLWQTMLDVNEAINTRIIPDLRKSAYDWSLTTSYGNCNDYAVQKRKKLMDYGISASALSLAVVHLPTGEGHLVLFIRTDRGDFILDNLREDILGEAEAGYRLIKWQSADNPGVWVAMQPAFYTPAVHARKGVEELKGSYELKGSGQSSRSYFAPRLDFVWIDTVSTHMGMVPPTPVQNTPRSCCG